MLCEHIEGSLCDDAFAARLSRELGDYEVEDVALTWDETNKRIMRKTGSRGTDVGIRLDEASRARGLRSGDVLGVDRERGRVLVAQVEKVKAIVARANPADGAAAARLGWEVGNTHTPLFAGERPGEYAVPWTEPLLALLQHLPGVETEVGPAQLDAWVRLGGGGVHAHHHDHGHTHDHAHGPGHAAGGE